MTSSARIELRARRAYVPTSALAKAVRIDDDMLYIDLVDGRVVGAPLIWFPALHHATTEQRADCEIRAGGRGLHWPQLDEDLSVSGLLAGGDRVSA